MMLLKKKEKRLLNPFSKLHPTNEFGKLLHYVNYPIIIEKTLVLNKIGTLASSVTITMPWHRKLATLIHA